MSDRPLGLNEYQRQAAKTALYPGRDGDTVAPYPALGLAGEAGEVCEQIKKAIRDDEGRVSEERRRKLQKELGDVMWYLAALASELGMDLETIAQANLDKLADRQRRGVIQGEGDDR